MLKTIQRWFVPETPPPRRRLYDPYIDKVIEQAEQCAVMFENAFQYDWERTRYEAGMYHRMIEQPFPHDASLHVPYYIAQEALRTVFPSEEAAQEDYRIRSYWMLFHQALEDSYQDHDVSHLTSRQQHMIQELYQRIGNLGFRYDSQYYDHTLSLEMAKTAVIIMVWLQKHGALQQLIEDFLTSFQKLFPKNTALVEFRGVAMNGTRVHNSLLSKLIPHAFRVSMMTTAFTVLNTAEVHDDAPWEWTRAMYIDAFVDTCRREQTIHKTLFRMFDIYKRYTHMA